MQIQSNIKIYTFYYQPTNRIQIAEEYEAIWAGKNGAEEQKGFTGDDTGDNISKKNKYYSELSGLYWVWKNTTADIVGSCHYRRYFTSQREPLLYKLKRLLYFPAGLMKKRHGLIYTGNIDFWQPRILRENDIKTLLDQYDAILPERRKLRYSIREHYIRYHNCEELDLIENILEEMYPEYLSTYHDVFKQNRLFANNMFILHKATFNNLMEWLCSILFEFEKRCELDSFTGYQERILGFLSERLITIWVIHQKLNYIELPLIYFKRLKQKQNHA